MSDLNDLFKVIAEGKKQYEETDPVGKKIKAVKDTVKVDLSSLFEELANLNKQLGELETIKEEKEVITEVSPIPAEPEIKTPEQRIQDTNDDVTKYLKDKSFQQPTPDVVDKNVDDIRKKIRFLEQAIGKIAAAGPGGGEVNLRWLDDVARETIADGRWLKYNGTTKKFEFDEINPYEVVHNVTEVTTATYTVQDNDYYIGVNYAGPVTITLPVSANSGRVVIIKDEDGDSETNPITVVGLVDNDPGGYVIQMNNGATQLIYRAGCWRII